MKETDSGQEYRKRLWNEKKQEGVAAEVNDYS